jgi:hypothetical protein
MTATALTLVRVRNAGRASRSRRFGGVGLLVGGYAVGLAAMGVGSYGAGGETTPVGGLRWLAVSIVGLLCSGIANGLWFMQARARIARERVLLLGPGAPRPRYLRSSLAMVSPPPSAEHVVSRPGSALYHRPGCALVVGRPAEAAPRAGHDDRGRRPCEVCEP